MKKALESFINHEFLKIDNFHTDSLTSRFHEIAEILLNKCLLNSGNETYRISEIEFYAYSNNHIDSYTHCDDTQKKFGHWYFHKIGNSFKNGNYKGLDLTLGDGTNYIGILIRGLQFPSNGSNIEGPSLVVDQILSDNKSQSIDDFLNSSSTVLDLIYSDSIKPDELLSGPRVGLSTKGLDQLPFQFIPFRYVIKSANTKKGKPLLYLHQYSLYGERARKKMQIREVDVKKYEAWMKNGMTMDADTAIKNSKKNVQSRCELFGAYRTRTKLSSVNNN